MTYRAPHFGTPLHIPVVFSNDAGSLSDEAIALITNFKNPGKSGTFSWEDITGEIYSSGKTKTEKGASIAEQYLSDEVDIHENIFDFFLKIL